MSCSLTGQTDKVNGDSEMCMMEPVLKIENITLDRGERRILDGLSVTVRPGERIVVRGPNGSGKTTLFKAVLGLLEISSGRILFRDRPVGGDEWRSIRNRIAWVPQEGVLHRFPVSAREVVAVGLSGRKIPRREREDVIHRALESSGAVELAERCFHRLSGGERQRVSIARCLAQGAEILLLDEPASALDTDARKRLVWLIDHLSETGRTVLAVTHEEGLFLQEGWKKFHLEKGRLC